MLKITLLSVIALSVIVLLISCENGDTILVNEENKILATVDVGHIADINSGRKYFYRGYLITNEISELQYVVLNLDTIHYSEQSYYYSNDHNGFIEFSTPVDKIINLVEDAKFEIHTDIGMIAGNIVFPDSITSVTYNKADTIQINETLIMSFDGKADYYLIYHGYSYLNEDSSGYISKGGETNVNENEAILDSTLYPFNGYLTIWGILSINGPLPETNSLPNLHGDGKGYLNVRIFQSFRKDFVIGEGFQLNE